MTALSLSDGHSSVLRFLRVTEMPGFQMALPLRVRVRVCVSNSVAGGEQTCSTSCFVPEVGVMACVNVGDLSELAGWRVQGAPQS